MKCPYCGHPEDKVIDSRGVTDDSIIRRRRECLKCSRRFTTYERVEEIPLMVVKKDGRREPFDRKKILNGLRFNTVLLEDPAMIKHIGLADLYYDKFNRIDLLEEASQHSRDMMAAALIRATEMTQDSGVKVDELTLEDRVYIEQPEVRETVTAGVAPAGAVSESGEAQEEEAVPDTKTNGLTEL